MVCFTFTTFNKDFITILLFCLGNTKKVSIFAKGIFAYSLKCVMVNAINTKMIRLRDISSAFSRSAFTDILLFDDYSHLDWLHSKYPTKSCTYIDLLKKAYSTISRDYRCEYVYKNELIKLLLSKYGTNKTSYFSEFRVGNSIADMAMFNGESKAFEIKTEYDSPRRLNKQLANFQLFFDKCFLVIPESLYNDYLLTTDPKTGIIVLRRNKGHISLIEKRPAIQNSFFDAELLMSCLRTEEYKSIVKSLGTQIEGVSGSEMYGYCRSIILKANTNILKSLFLQEIRKRKNNTRYLRRYPVSLRQMMLSLNLPEKKANILLEKLNTTVIKA